MGKVFLQKLFKVFEGPGSKAGVATLNTTIDPGLFLVNTVAELANKLAALHQYQGKVSSTEIVSSIEEVILRMASNTLAARSKVILMILDAEEVDLNNMDIFAPLMKRELEINNIKLLILAIGKNRKVDHLRLLTDYQDEVLVLERFENLLDEEQTSSVAISLCQVGCK